MDIPPEAVEAARYGMATFSAVLGGFLIAAPAGTTDGADTDGKNPTRNHAPRWVRALMALPLLLLLGWHCPEIVSAVAEYIFVGDSLGTDLGLQPHASTPWAQAVDMCNRAFTGIGAAIPAFFILTVAGKILMALLMKNGPRAVGKKGFFKSAFTMLAVALLTIAFSIGCALLSIPIGALAGRIISSMLFRVSGPFYPVAAILVLLSAIGRAGFWIWTSFLKGIERRHGEHKKSRAPKRLNARRLTLKQTQALVAAYAEQQASAAQRIGRRIMWTAAAGALAIPAAGIAMGASGTHVLVAIGFWLLVSRLSEKAVARSKRSERSAIRIAGKNPADARIRVAAMLPNPNTYRHPETDDGLGTSELETLVEILDELADRSECRLAKT